MCEFCKEHGEGKKWYLQAKNYAMEMFHQELSSEQKDIVNTETRSEWVTNFFSSFVLPATDSVSKRADDETQDASTSEKPKAQPSEDEILRRRKVTHFGQVLPIEDVEEVIDMVSSITRLPCGCRFISTGKADKRYCFGVAMDTTGTMGVFPDSSASFEVLDKEEAKSLFRGYDEEGLMHSIWTGVTPYVIGICNCDRDCMAYRLYIDKDGIPTFFRAEYICQTDWDLCTGCKSCMQQCQFGAISYSSALSKCYINPVKCYGCGVCRTACQHEAISLVARKENPEAADIWLKTRHSL
jgi:ferredoxin